MKVLIQQSELFPVLQSVARSCGIKTTLPVLSNVLLSTSEGKLVLSATNLELGVIKKVDAQIIEEGEITVPARTFVEIIASLTGSTIELESFQELLKITTPSFSANLNGISAQEFPAIPLASDHGITLDGKILKESIPEIVFAAAADEGRPVLTGILTEIKKGSLELVATDGFRLAHKSVKTSQVNGLGFRSLIPRRTFEEVVRLIAEEPSLKDSSSIDVATTENQNQMIFKIGDTQLSSRLIEGQFPSWEKIVPANFTNKTVIDRADLLKAVKLASVFARGEANIIKLQTSNNKLKLASEGRELGTQQTELEAVSEGEDITIAFNAKFLQDALAAATSAKVLIHFSGNLTPAVIKPDADEELEYVIMPIRVS